MLSLSAANKGCKQKVMWKLKSKTLNIEVKFKGYYFANTAVNFGVVAFKLIQTPKPMNWASGVAGLRDSYISVISWSNNLGFLPKIEWSGYLDNPRPTTLQNFIPSARPPTPMNHTRTWNIIISHHHFDHSLTGIMDHHHHDHHHDHWMLIGSEDGGQIAGWHSSTLNTKYLSQNWSRRWWG